ncbi:hypothetical protein BT96DRAFT_328173 [Gymnopus androsaceus JB14]|uniref:F-box domain-containing protein n=1 Tax=Gymnopus androsaceus JB14 TaxID=1447944 RepID=A0A6A4I6J8_9AGAR|nr:hypothetical protein BT96DRAFT_328173 [Gymnopus androsaceus JB14]
MMANSSHCVSSQKRPLRLPQSNSPINRIPIEVLARILLLVCEKNRLSNGGDALYTSFVCSLWRELAFSYPALWSNMSIFLGGDLDDEDDADEEEDDKRDYRSYLERFEAVVDLYLERSKEHLLNLKIEATDIWESGEHPIFTKLAKSSYRWKSVEFHVFLLKPLIYPCLGDLDLPELEEVKVWQDGDEELGDLDVFARAPKLHSLESTLTGLSLNSTILGQIRSLVYSPDSGNFYEMIKLCPNLRNLAVQCSPPSKHLENQIYTSDPPRVLPITSLEVSLPGYPLKCDMLQSTLSSLAAPYPYPYTSP